MARTRTAGANGATRSSRIRRLPGETLHQHRIRSYELRHPGATRQQARGHYPGATKPTSAEKLARAREHMAQGLSATDAAKRAGISRETLTRELQTDPNIVRLGGRYVDRKILELLRYRQQLGAAYKDKFENVEAFFAARPLPEQIDDLEEAKRLHSEWLDNGKQPLGRPLNMYLAYHTTT